MCPEDHLKAFLKRDTRPDGRSLEEFRPIIIAPNVLNRFVAVKSNVPQKDKKAVLYGPNIYLRRVRHCFGSVCNFDFKVVTVRVWSD